MAEEELLCQRWLHSHEEDTKTEMVYRPASHPFPPSRGRAGFDLRANGSCVRIGIAARDGATEKPCMWRSEDDGGRQLVLSLGAGESVSYTIVSLDRDKLVVKK